MKFEGTWHIGCSIASHLKYIGVNVLSQRWYVIYSNPHKEQQAQFHLGLKGVQTFFPRLHVPATTDSKGKVVPLFRNYLFAWIDVSSEYHLVIWTPGVRRLVSFGGEPVPVQDDVVQFLKERADLQGVIPARSKLRRSQEVEIAGGPFDGLLGIIHAPPDDKGRVKVLLKLLNRQVSVRFGVEFIKGGRTAWTPAMANSVPN
jgi:transcriptional antiterminator RfaH